MDTKSRAEFITLVRNATIRGIIESMVLLALAFLASHMGAAYIANLFAVVGLVILVFLGIMMLVTIGILRVGR